MTRKNRPAWPPDRVADTRERELSAGLAAVDVAGHASIDGRPSEMIAIDARDGNGPVLEVGLSDGGAASIRPLIAGESQPLLERDRRAVPFR